MFVAKRVIDKRIGFGEGYGGIVDGDARLKTIHEFDGMMPNTTHFAFDVPAQIGKRAVLMPYHVEPVASGVERTIEVVWAARDAFCIGKNGSDALRNNLLRGKVKADS